MGLRMRYHKVMTLLPSTLARSTVCLCVSASAWGVESRTGISLGELKQQSHLSIAEFVEQGLSNAPNIATKDEPENAHKNVVELPPRDFTLLGLLETAARNAAVLATSNKTILKTSQIRSSEIPNTLPAELAYKANRRKPVTAPTATSKEHLAHTDINFEAPATALANLNANPISTPPSTPPVPATLALSDDGIVLTLENGALQVKPERLTFKGVGDQKAYHVISKQAKNAPTVFVRDQSLVRYVEDGPHFEALAEGSTEVFFQFGKTMLILPVTIGKSTKGEDLTAPPSLVSLDSVAGVSSNANFGTNLSHRTSHDILALDDIVRQSKAPATATTGGTDRHAERAGTVQAPLYMENREATMTKVSIQVLDDRTDPLDKTTYPVQGVKISIVGTKFVGQTDVLGLVRDIEVPSKSRLLVKVTDERGNFAPSTFEVTTSDLEDSGVKRVHVMRNFMLRSLASVANQPIAAGNGSMCGSVLEDGVPQSDVSIELNVNETYPMFFNEYGYLDPSMQVSGSDGRFCLFNVSPGPVFMTFIRVNTLLGRVPTMIAANEHIEHNFELAHRGRIATLPAAGKTAAEQIESPTDADAYHPVEGVRLVALGDEDFTQGDNGELVTENEVTFDGGQTFYLSQASEFEPALYRFDDSNVTPLVPRGFVMDLAYRAELAQDAALGSVLVEHGALEGQAAGDAVHLRLFAATGHELTEQATLRGAQSTKSLFFNVEPGIYTAIAETSDGYWLSVSTVIVYSETMSYVRTGNILLHPESEGVAGVGP